MCLFLTVSSLLAQGKAVSGIVVDASNQDPLFGAAVIVKGVSGSGTMTNAEGKFTLKNVKAGAVLVISYMGYSSKEISVGAQTNFKIELSSQDKQLEKIVVTALGIKRSQKALI